LDVLGWKFAGLDIAIPLPRRVAGRTANISIAAVRNTPHRRRTNRSEGQASDFFPHPSRSTDHTLSCPDIGDYELTGVALNRLFAIESMRGRHQTDAPRYGASRRVRSRQTGLPESDYGTDRNGERNGNQNPQDGREKDRQ
jgi:hypothetical protein